MSVSALFAATLIDLVILQFFRERCPLLTQQAKVNRLTWARDHFHYNWNKVVFSDETTIQMFCNTTRAWSCEKNQFSLWLSTHLKLTFGLRSTLKEKSGYTYLQKT